MPGSSTRVPGAGDFKFESAPIWDPDGPVKLARVRDPARVVLVAETASAFPEVDIMSLRYYDAYRPGHLPRQSGERISDDRHEGTANLLFFDTSARQVRRGAMELEMFDDGVTDRAARPVWDDRGS